MDFNPSVLQCICIAFYCCAALPIMKDGSWIYKLICLRALVELRLSNFVYDCEMSMCGSNIW